VNQNDHNAMILMIITSANIVLHAQRQSFLTLLIISVMSNDSILKQVQQLLLGVQSKLQ